MKIPAISGGGATSQFKKVFWAAVTEKDATTGLPQRGSLGVHWNVYRDLRGLASTNLLEQLLLCRINKISPRNPSLTDPLISKISAGFLKTFYEFCEQTEQPFFFIKNGAMPLYLVRKTSNYLYDSDHEFPHRIAYEFVRVVTESEGRQRLGDGNKAMFMMELEGPILAFAIDTSTDVSINTSTDVSINTSTDVSIKEPVIELNPNLGNPIESVPEVMASIEKPKRASKKKAVTAVVKQERKPKPTKATKTTKTTTATTATAVTAVTATAATAATVTTAVSSHLHPIHLETADEPLSVDSVELIKLQTFDANGTPVYRDPLKNKLYKQHTNGSIGPYIGRWSSKEERIYEDVPDSDREEE